MNDRKSQKPQKVKTIQVLAAWVRKPVFKIALATFLFICIGTSAVVLHYYSYYSRMIDRKLNGEIFKNTARVYAVPYHIYPGQRIAPDIVISRLQRAGFEPVGATNGGDGKYEVANNRITIRPTIGDVLRLDFQKGVLTKITKPNTGELDEAWLPAELVTNLFDETREKRRIVTYDELPKFLINALLASEDQRFFSHWGLDPVRLVGAVVASRGHSDRVRGTSTITQQLARNFFLTRDRSMTRKINEAFISLILEHRATKQQILTMYANEVLLGQRGSFSIHGFGEGAASFFGKDLTALTLPEAATLVAIIPAPNGAFSPVKHPEDAKKRRNLVLTTMADLHMVTAQESTTAKQAALNLAPLRVDSTDAPYMVDYIREELLKDFAEDTLVSDSLRVYTTLDPELQRVAVEAVGSGLKFVNEQIAPRLKGKKDVDPGPPPQAGLIALNPHTGAILAMVGGSDYGASQYNRITKAFRQPGSIFKPFVYAAAFEAAYDAVHPQAAAENPPEPPGSAQAATPVSDTQPAPEPRGEFITPATTLVDEPTTFVYDGSRTYEPNNYHQQYRGTVTVREALQHSLNIPTIRLAEKIGYGRVASLARRTGMNAKIKAYPSLALGAFEVTPIEMARAYTVFANEGKRLDPHAVLRVVAADGSVTKAYKYEETPVLPPAVVYMMTNLMEGVINSGTGAGVRSRGFTLPAAGKTGTSRDGWFAGYTKDLLVIAWVGYDDNRDLNLEGAKSALPIWTEFMMKAQKLYPPRDPDEMHFKVPEGVEFVHVDSESHLPATSECPSTYDEVFISGTVPSTMCPLHTPPPFSEVIQNGVTEAGKGAANALKSVGKIIGGIFK
jgi:penicillin-binding protein 1B